jgi:hypothetical protein
MIGSSLTAPPTVVAQQYSSATFASLRFRFHKEKSGAFKKFYFFFLSLLLKVSFSLRLRN